MIPSTRIAAEELGGPVSGALLQFVAGVSRSKTKFPGPNPCSVERKDFQTLANQRYHLAAKNDGVRAALVCLRVNGVDYAAFMDRNRKLYAVRGAPLHIPTAWYQGTLVDGELMPDEFLAFDAPVVAGVVVGHLPFSARQRAMSHGIALHLGVHTINGAPKTPRPAVLMYMKAFAHPAEFTPSQGTGHLSDGIIAMPEDPPYVIGRHTTLFKLKTHHTVDFMTDANGGLSVQERGIPKPVERLAASDGDLPPPGAIVECERGPSGWVVCMTRTDKGYPNDIVTYRATLRNMKENISYDEFVDVCRRSQNSRL
jgi:hypothetical protein